MTDGVPDETPTDSRIDAFWDLAKHHARLEDMPGYFGPTALGSVPPPAWSFGGNEEQANELLKLVLKGIKTATASALWDYEAEGEDLPVVGALGIITDSDGNPHVLVATEQVEVKAFNEVDAEHARREGEGDLSLDYWRETHQRFFTTHAVHDRGFAEDMPVVLERFQVLYEA